MTALPTIYITLYNRLIHSDLGGGTCCGIASSSTYNIIYRAFRRCQTRAPAEGFVRLRSPDAVGGYTAKRNCGGRICRE